jgi:hypothetical protein
MNGFVFNELPPAVISNCRLLGCFVPGKNGKIASGAHADDAPGTYLFNKKPMSGTQGECVLGLFCGEGASEQAPMATFYGDVQIIQ